VPAVVDVVSVVVAATVVLGASMVVVGANGAVVSSAALSPSLVIVLNTPAHILTYACLVDMYGD
jgi:hypothetical protein